MAYSARSDLLVGAIPLPTYLDPDKYITDASDEVDSKIGFVYKTPLDFSDTSPLARPARLLVKRIANFLASGRLLLSVKTSDEQNSINAYGASLIKEANAALEQIRSGEIRLEGALPAEGVAPAVNGPMIGNIDPVSNVEAFYDNAYNTVGSGMSGLSESRPRR